MHRFILAIPLLLHSLAPCSIAQTTAGTRRDSVYRAMLNFVSLVQGGRVTPQWLPDKPAFWYVEERSDSAVALRVNAATGNVTPLLDVARARAALRKVMGKEPPSRGLPFRSFTLAPDERSVSFELDSTKYRLDLPGYLAQVLGPATPAAAPRPTESASPDGKWLARAEGNNLWVRPASGDSGVQLTTDGVDRFGWKGPPTGTFNWSPDGTRFLAIKADERQVHHLPVVHWLNAEQEKVDWVAYAHAGSTVPSSALYAVDVSSRRVTRIETGGQAEAQLRPAGWRKDGEEAYLLRTDRFLKRVELLAADPRNGAIRVLLTETQPTFVEGLALNPANLFTPFSDGSKFIWRSERDGWSHLYLYQRDGTLLRRLTSGAFPVEGVVAIDEKGGWVYYLARDDPARPYDLHFHRVSLEGGSPRRLTAGTGEHSVAMSPDHQYFIDTWSTVSRPPVVALRKSDGTLVRELAKADITKLTGLDWKEPEVFLVKAADGTTDLYGVLYRPFDFDPSRKYPVIDLQYMGNFTHMTPRVFHQTWLGDEAQALTQLGFIVLVVDGRGTTGRGKAFQDFTYNSIGMIEVPDHAAALRQVAATRPWMDSTRVGITGFSWGGYYTLRALLTAPELYKVGVAGAPVVDLLAHVSPIEPYMGRPQDNAEAYARASNLPLASRLQGKLLMTIGTTDVNVTFNHTMRMADAFIKAGKHFDLLVMPEEAHGLTPAGLAYYKEARARYFVEHLRP